MNTLQSPVQNLFRLGATLTFCFFPCFEYCFDLQCPFRQVRQRQGRQVGQVQAPSQVPTIGHQPGSYHLRYPLLREACRIRHIIGTRCPYGQARCFRKLRCV